jgi:hypothetical protein
VNLTEAESSAPTDPFCREEGLEDLPQSIFRNSTAYSAAMNEIAAADRQKVGVLGFDDQNERCSGFEVRRRWRSSAQSTPRSTTISIRSTISSPAGLQAEAHGRIGGVARACSVDRRSRSGTKSRYFDNAEEIGGQPRPAEEASRATHRTPSQRRRKPMATDLMPDSALECTVASCAYCVRFNHDFSKVPIYALLGCAANETPES